jgi:hypothetical protein
MRNYRYFVLFLGGVFLSIILFMTNLIVFGIVKAGTGVSSIVIIVISCVGVVFVAAPLLAFIGYHVWLIVTGNV